MTMTNDLTPKEKALILRYTQDCYTDGDPAQHTWAWSLCETRADAAVWGSLVKKGYGFSYGTGKEAALGLSGKGIEAYRTLVEGGQEAQ